MGSVMFGATHCAQHTLENLSLALLVILEIPVKGRRQEWKVEV
jgi:hypothetical protein